MEPGPDKSKWTVEVFDSIEELKAAEDAENAAAEVTPEMKAFHASYVAWLEEQKRNPIRLRPIGEAR